MIESDGREVQAVAAGGAIKYGHAVRFDLRFEDGSVEAFHCDHACFNKLLTSLKGLGKIAEQKRLQTSPKQKFEVVDPYRAETVRAGSTPDGTQLSIQFGTSDGMPLDVAMPRSMAEQLVDKLQRVLAYSAINGDLRS
jgi:hypothetical protein